MHKYLMDIRANECKLLNELLTFLKSANFQMRNNYKAIYKQTLKCYLYPISRRSLPLSFSRAIKIYALPSSFRQYFEHFKAKQLN